MKKLILVHSITFSVLLGSGIVYFSKKNVNETEAIRQGSNQLVASELELIDEPQHYNSLSYNGEDEKEIIDQNEGETQSNEQPSNIAELEERYRNASNNENYPTLADRVSAIRARRPNTDISPEDVVAAVEKGQAWKIREDPGAVAQKLSQRELNDGRAFIEFDPVKVETLMPEDLMDIDIDSIGRTLEMKVENVEAFSDQNIVWRGKIVNQGGTDAENGTVVITQSPKVTVASIVLHDKDYTLESYGSDGWVSNTGALYKIEPNDEH